jgi:hypothetical protein
MKRILPLRQPPIISYYTYMFRLGIMAARDEYLPWLFSNHIQLFHIPGELLHFYTHPWCTTPRSRDACLSTCPLLDSMALDRGMWRHILAGDPVSYVIQCIDDGYYVQVDEDDFYVPSSVHFGRQHLLHELLIVGYDQERELLYSLGFYRGRFAVTALSYQQFKEAVAVDMGLLLDNEEARGRLFDRKRENMLERPQAMLYRYREGAAVRFDAAAVGEQLRDYLMSANSSQRYRSLVAPISGAIWGMEIHAFLIEHLSRVENKKEEYNPIFVRIFCEHKNVMAMRLRYMADRGLLKAADLVGAYQRLAGQVRSVHLLMYRWMRDPQVDRVKTAINSLRNAADREGEILGPALEEIDLIQPQDTSLGLGARSSGTLGKPVCAAASPSG